MLELLKDFSIRFYDGCLVLQVYDHRRENSPAAASSANGGVSNISDNPTGAVMEDATKHEGGNKTTSERTEAEKTVSPKTYRTLLRPTPLSLYYDLLYHTDSALTKFTDQLSLQMEAEILTLTNRKLDLSVPLNPYLQDTYLHPESEFPQRKWDKTADEWKIIHSHLEETPREQRRLRADQLVIHRTSEYEELMCLLSNNYKTSSEAATGKRLVVAGPSAATSSDPVSLESTPFAPSLAQDKSKRTEKTPNISAAASVLAGNLTSNQFMRLRFIEEIRKRKLSQKAQAGAAMAAQSLSQTQPTPARPEPSMTMHRQQHLKQQALAKNMLAQLQQQQPPHQTPSQPAVQHLPQSLPGRQQMGQAPTQHMSTQSQQPVQPMFQAGGIAQQRPVQNYPGQPMPNMVRNANPGQVPQQQQQMNKQAQLMRAQQMQIQQARQQQIRQQQQPQQQSLQPIPGQMHNQMQNQMQNQMPAAKRAKMMASMNQIQPQGQAYTPSHSPLMGNSQPGSGISTPVIPAGNLGTPQMGSTSLPWQQMGQVPLPGQRMQNMTPVNVGNVGSGNMGNVGNVGPAAQNVPRVGQRPTTQPATGSSTVQSLQQQQQQQIFQMSLSPQEQHTFRQLQARMNALVQMSNTGVAPNRGRLTPQQQQQAMQQAKHIQQQLLQRFPTYFQRLRQYQLLQQQRRQTIQRQQQAQSAQSQSQSSDVNGMDNGMYQNRGVNLSLPMMQQQMMGLPMMQQQRNANGKQ